MIASVAVGMARHLDLPEVETERPRIASPDAAVHPEYRPARS